MKKKSFLALAVAAFIGFSFFEKTAEPVSSGTYSLEKQIFKLDTVVSALKSPWGMALLPNGDMLVTEKKGALRLIQNGKLHPDPIGGIPEVHTKSQAGLFEVKLHPEYEKNGWIYLSYASPIQNNEKGEGANTAFIRGRLKDHQLVDQELLFKASPNYKRNVHFGGRIEFDRKGYMYLTVGDRGGRDENQTLENYRGKVFRLHDDGHIPDDNPFVGEKNAKTETFTYGHRNPQGLALNPETGEIWEHEHGPQGGDELNIIRRGNNYGWPTITYGINYNNTIITKDTVMEGMEQPTTFWRPSIAPCGMDFISSDIYGKFKGNLLVGSLKFNYIEICKIEDNKVINKEIILKGIGRVRSIHQEHDGYVYVVLEHPGQVVRLMPD